MNYRLTRIAVAMAAIAVVGWWTSSANATILTTKDSAAFDYKYEMDAAPDAVDLDSNGTMDFRTTNGGTVSGGTLSMSVSGPSGCYTSDTVGQIWPGKATFNTGYTIEARVKILSATAYGYGLQGIPGPTSVSQPCSELWINTNKLVWNDGPSAIVLADGQDNTDTFHVFRLAQEPGVGAPGSAKYSVWRDGILVTDSLSEAFMNGGLERLVFGAFASGNSSTTETDYVRFTVGAYAPVPEPMGIVLLGSSACGLLVYAWRKRN